MFPAKYRIHAFLIVISLVIIIYPQLSKKPDEQRLEASRIAVAAFLEQIDAGQYAQSWDTASAYMKNDIPREQWIAQLTETREQVGKLVERTEEKHLYANNLEEKKGVPAGEYFTFIYSAKYEKRDEVRETVTLMFEKDKVWRVAGYFTK